MPRPSRVRERRQELLPVLADAFTELGYRRATTAAIARRCGVRENILYRLWPDKKAMFVAAIDYVYDFSEQTWLRLLGTARGNGNAARKILEYEAAHHGEFGHYRIVFNALAEADDPDVREALRRMFARFHRFLESQIASQRRSERRGDGVPPELAAWAVIGLGTACNIGREVGALRDGDRKRLIGVVGRVLLEGGA